MDKTQLQWLLAGIGVVTVALIYLWGIRTRLREEIRKRRRRSSANEPKLGETSTHLPDEAGEVHEFGELGRVTPDHHLADKILVDVEIRPLNRGTDVQRAPAFGKSPLERDKPVSNRETVGTWPFDSQPEPTLEPMQEPMPEPTPEPTPQEPIAEQSLAVEAPSAPKTTIALTVMAPRQQSFRGTAIRAAAEEAGLRLGLAGLFEGYPEGGTAADTPVFSLAHLRKPGSFEPDALAELTTPGLLAFMSLPGPVDAMKALEMLLLAVDQVARKLGGVICDEHRHKLTNRGLSKLRDKVAELDRSSRL